MKIKNIQFRTTVLQSNSRQHGVYFEPKEKMGVINQFMITYSNSKSVRKLLDELKEGKEYIGIDESHIYISNSKVIFDMKLVTELEPVEIQLEDAIEMFEMYNDYLIKYESSKIPGLLSEEKIKNVEWDYISGWEKEGKLKPVHLVKWAYLENGYFSEQDEDLLMYKPNLISTMHDLMIDKYSKRKADLLKILKAYANHSYQQVKDEDAISEFKMLLNHKSNNEKHIDLVDFITKLEENKA